MPLASLLPDAARSETVVAHFMRDRIPEHSTIVLLTQQGRIKRLLASELANLTARGVTLVKFKDEDILQQVSLAQPGEQLVIATSNGRLLRFEINDEQLPLMGRTAQGNQALRLRKRERLIGCVAISADDNLLLVTEQGYGKRLPVGVIRLVNRGDLGTQALQFKNSTDVLVGILSASGTSEVALATSEERVVRLPLKSVKMWGKDGAGDRIAKLKPEEKILTVTSIVVQLP
jgi:DNA gyrase subunit A